MFVTYKGRTWNVGWHEAWQCWVARELGPADHQVELTAWHLNALVAKMVAR